MAWMSVLRAAAAVQVKQSKQTYGISVSFPLNILCGRGIPGIEGWGVGLGFIRGAKKNRKPWPVKKFLGDCFSFER